MEQLFEQKNKLNQEKKVIIKDNLKIKKIL